MQEGRARCTVGDKKYDVGAGDIISIPAGTPHGFTNIVLISDNGGSNQEGLAKVAKQLNEQWGATMAYYIPEYYQSWEAADARLLEKGLTKQGVRDGIHDDPSVTLIMMQTDPALVRYAAVWKPKPGAPAGSAWWWNA